MKSKLARQHEKGNTLFLAAVIMYGVAIFSVLKLAFRYF